MSRIRSWGTDRHNTALMFVHPDSPQRPPGLRLLSRVADAPDGFRAVISDQQRAILPDGDAHGAPPHVAVIHDESRHEILILSGGVTSLMQWHSNELITYAN